MEKKMETTVMDYIGTTKEFEKPAAPFFAEASILPRRVFQDPSPAAPSCLKGVLSYNGNLFNRGLL